MKLNRFARNWSLCWDRFPATLPSPAPTPLCTYCPKWPAPCPVVNALVDFWQMARPMAGATYFLARALCCCCPPLPPLWLWFSVPPMQWATFCTTWTNIRNVLRFVAPTVKQSLNVPCLRTRGVCVMCFQSEIESGQRQTSWLFIFILIFRYLYLLLHKLIELIKVHESFLFICTIS